MNCMTEFDSNFFLIDTNILVYAYDNTEGVKHIIAKNLIDRCWKREVTYTISAQNLAEFVVVVTKKIPSPLPYAVAEQIVKDISSFSHWKVLTYNATTVLSALRLFPSPQKSFWDALLTATMLQHGVYGVYTENAADFRSLQQIAVVNPFITKLKKTKSI